MSHNLDLNQIKNDINSGKLTANKKASKSSKYRMFFFLMIPTIIFGFVAYLVYSNTVNFLNYAEATGEVVETENDTRTFKGNGKIPDLVIAEVQDLELQIITKNGEKVNIPMKGLDRNSFKVGDKADIYYDSVNYSDATLKTDSLWGTSIMLLFPLFFCLLPLFFALLVLFKG